MNQTTRDIMKLLGIDVDDAIDVQNIMADYGVDFSEISRAGFNRTARAAYKQLIGE